ncbi:MAG: hypothetical protein BWK80_61920, partial [Desulfobacteraceae bacterium IS3]
MNWLSLLFPSTWNPLSSLYDLFSRETRISTQAINDLFIQVTVCIALIFVCWILKLTVKSRTGTGRYLNVLRKEDAEAKAGIESSKLPLFQAFRHHLLTLFKRDGTDGTSLYRTVDAAEIFSDSALAPGFIGSRLFLAIPGFLTGIGVLGTFVGLQIGIGGLDLTNIRNLEHSIIPLIQGCAVAFSTSVWGVTCSLLFSIFEKILEGWTLGKIRKLQNRVDALIPRYVPEEAMAEMERSSRGTEEILKGLAVAIGEQMQKAIGQLGTEIKTAVSEATSEGHGPLMEKSAKFIADALNAELSSLKEQIGEMSSDFSEQFSGVSGQLTGSINSFEPTVRKLSETVENTGKTVTNAVEKLNAHEAVMEKMSSAATEIHQASQAFAETKQTMLDSAEKNKDAADAQNSAAQINKDVAGKFEQVGERLPDIQETIKDAARVIASISGPLGELKTYLEKLPQEHKEFQEKINTSNTEQT